jgi:hypothetical protein
LNVTTTACSLFRVQITSDNFIGNRSTVLAYRAANISSYCAQVPSTTKP